MRCPEITTKVLWASAWVLLFALVVQQIKALGDFRIDDAFISFSFAKNLACGNGLTFSNGIRVEGYSNFLWVVLNALGFLVVGTNRDPYLVARILAFGFLIVAVVITYQLARRHSSSLVSLGAVALMLSCTDIVRAALSGLETVPFMATVAFGWLIYLREPEKARRFSLLAFLPAALMRIDGFIPMLVVLGFETMDGVTRRRGTAAQWLRWALPAVAAWTTYFAWRWHYYGLFLPSTYYAKSLVTFYEPARGWHQVRDFFREYAALVALPWIATATLAKPRRDALGIALALGTHITYVGLIGGDWMPFRRFFIPAIPFAVVLIAWGAQKAYDYHTEQPILRKLVVGTLAFLSVGSIARYAHGLSIETKLERGKIAHALHIKTLTHDELLASVQLMQYVVREKTDKLVTDYAGVFGYYVDAKVIDQWGLCQSDIARRGTARGVNSIYGKACPECYKTIAPNYFHVAVPIVRAPNSYRNFDQLLSDIFQGEDIDRYMSIRRHFAVGRVTELRTNRTLWFVERRMANRPLVRRTPALGFAVDYPFEETVQPSKAPS